MLRISSVCAIHPAAYEQARRILLYIPDPSCAETLSTGDGGIRTLDPLLARQVLSQLSYTPMGFLFIYLGFYPMGLSGPFPYGEYFTRWA